MTGPVVETRDGKVRGIVERSSEGFDIWAFKGVPYAQPPIGELRFQDPVPAEKWTGVRDATKYGPICAQRDIILQIQSDSEDCLHLNVYVKCAIDPNARKAVMVWIHGGGFYAGYANDLLYGPDYLVKNDVILVTINYRLGVFGFLNLEDEIAPGNQGLKDQVMALQWVHDNIQQFGGNPGNVTVFGESAGGASVHYLALSLLTKGLIHKAISQSGVAFNPWARVDNPKKYANELCSLLGKQLTDSKAIVEFLKTVESKLLLEAQDKIIKAFNGIIFGPGVDAKSPNPFMPLPVDEVGQQGVHIPYLLGNNSREGIFFLLVIKKEDAFRTMDQNFDLMMPLNSMRILDKYNLTSKQLRRLYYKSEKVSVENSETFVDLLGDLAFIVGIHNFVKIQVERSSTPTYLYRLSYDPGSSLIKSQVSSQISGTSHFDDIAYLFRMRVYDNMSFPQLKKGTKDYRIMDQMTTLWTNFAKYGRPTIATSESIPVHWQPITDGTVLCYLNIDEDVTMQSTLNIELKYASAKSIKA